MKFERGRFIAKMRDGAIREFFFFLEIKQDDSGVWRYKMDDGDWKLLDENARDYILQDMYLVHKFKPDEKPVFSNIKVIVLAEGIHGSEFEWTKTNGEALEILIKRFPSLVDAFWHDDNRRKRIWEYLKDYFEHIRAKNNLKRGKRRR